MFTRYWLVKTYIYCMIPFWEKRKNTCVCVCMCIWKIIWIFVFLICVKSCHLYLEIIQNPPFFAVLSCLFDIFSTFLTSHSFFTLASLQSILSTGARMILLIQLVLALRGENIQSRSLFYLNTIVLSAGVICLLVFCKTHQEILPGLFSGVPLLLNLFCAWLSRFSSSRV